VTFEASDGIALETIMLLY